MSTTPQTEPAQAGGDPSMEDILASIRRILSEEEQPGAPANQTHERPPEDDILVLDPSMMVAEPASDPHAAQIALVGDPPEAGMLVVAPAEPSTLVAPETARAAAASVAGLVATLAAERGTQAWRGGPTIEDMMRAELRPLLKEWLDTHLPPMVERLVRVEIERVVGRTLP